LQVVYLRNDLSLANDESGYEQGVLSSPQKRMGAKIEARVPDAVQHERMKRSPKEICD